MSEQSENAGRGPVIALAGKRKWGYDVEQVDQFLARAHELYDSVEPKLTQRDIQRASFDLVKNGYVIAQVDAALSRLERAVVDKHTTWELEHSGRIPFKARSEAMLAALEAHYRRDPKNRFKAGLGKQPSYDRKQVDRLVDQVIAKVSSILGVEGAQPTDSKKLIDITAARVSNVIFTQRKGKRGYDERSVDYYLDAAVQLLSRLESYARVGDYASEPSEVASASAPAMPAPVAPAPAPSAEPVAQSAPRTEVIAPLFPGNGAEADAPAAPTPVAPVSSAANDHDFSELTAAERSIFKPAPAAPDTVAAPAAPAVAAPVASGSLAALAKSVDQQSREPAVESAPTEAVPPVAVSEAPVPVASPAPAVVPAPVQAPPTPVEAPAAAAPATVDAPAAAPAPNISFSVDAEPQAAAAKDDSDADQYLANLLSNTSFPKVDLDIPDLTFPSLNDSVNDANQSNADTPDSDGDQQGR